MNRVETAQQVLRRVQRLRKAALLVLALGAVALLPFVKSAWPENVHETVESIGLGFIIMAIAGRAWCTLYIGGRKLNELVTTGPYSISRNPLYVFTFFGVLGIGMQTGAVTPGLVLALATISIFRIVVAHEERELNFVFGEKYNRYCQRVPRFGPRFSDWQDSAHLYVDPARLLRTVADAAPLLLAFPLMETLELVQDAGFVSPYLSLY